MKRNLVLIYLLILYSNNSLALGIDEKISTIILGKPNLSCDITVATFQPLEKQSSKIELEDLILNSQQFIKNDLILIGGKIGRIDSERFPVNIEESNIVYRQIFSFQKNNLRVSGMIDAYHDMTIQVHDENRLLWHLNASFTNQDNEVYLKFPFKEKTISLLCVKD